MKRIVLLRHGESEWNQQNRFTGWIDVDLSEKGIVEANNAGITLRKAGITFDVAYTSYLKELSKHSITFSTVSMKSGFPCTNHGGSTKNITDPYKV